MDDAFGSPLLESPEMTCGAGDVLDRPADAGADAGDDEGDDDNGSNDGGGSVDDGVAVDGRGLCEPCRDARGRAVAV